MLRRLLIAALAGMLLVVVPATESEAANVCWCRAADMAERVADADHVFKFRIDELVPKTEHKAVAFGEVVEVFKGDVEQRVRVGLRLRTTCMNFDDLVPGVVAGAIGRKGEYRANGMCDEQSTNGALNSISSPIPQPGPSEGRPAFLVSNRRLGARVAVLSERLETAYVGSGLGRVEQVAVCPTGRFAVEIVVKAGSPGAMSLETRDLATLEIVNVVSLQRNRRDMSRVADLGCHDEAAMQLSYLIVNGLPRGAERGEARRASVIEMWSDGELALEIPARDAQKLLVDQDRGLAYTLVRGPAPWIDRFDLEGGTFDRNFDLGARVAADFAIDLDSGDVLVLVGDRLDRPKKKHGKGHLVRISGDEVTETEIRRALRPRLIEVIDGQIHTLVSLREEGDAYQVRGRKGKVLEETLLARSSVALMVPNEGLIFVTSGRDLRLLDSEGERAAMANTFAGAIAAIPLSADVEIMSGDLPPIEEGGGSIVAGGPLPPSQRVPQFEPQSQRFWLLGLAGVALVCAIFLAAIRRRRLKTDDGWMDHTRNEGPGGPS